MPASANVDRVNDSATPIGAEISSSNSSLVNWSVSWNPPPAALRKPSQLFAASVYVRGGMALEALRERIGNKAFYSTLRTWAATHQDGNATVQDFTALAEQQSNKNLDALFGRYLYKRGKP